MHAAYLVQLVPRLFPPKLVRTDQAGEVGSMRVGEKAQGMSSPSQHMVCSI